MGTVSYTHLDVYKRQRLDLRKYNIFGVFTDDVYFPEAAGVVAGCDFIPGFPVQLCGEAFARVADLPPGHAESPRILRRKLRR